MDCVICKDLERALKDKERYRKKLKESLAQISNPSPVDSTQGVPSEVGSVSSESRTVEAAKSASKPAPPASVEELPDLQLPHPLLHRLENPLVVRDDMASATPQHGIGQRVGITQVR